MELTRIGDDGLKIALSAEDMLLYNVEGGCIDCPSERAPRMIREILREAHRRTGFDDSGGRIMVQVFESAGGGCEMFVTRLCSRGRLRACRVGDMQLLFRLCRALSACASEGDGVAYRTDDGGYLLVLPCGSGGEIMSEFGDVFYTSEGYLSEHCSEICKGAVCRLGSLA